MWNPVSIIGKKRDGQALSREEIEAFVRGVTDGSFADYQAAALLMAITLNGMDDRETVDLTMAMARSGEMLDLAEIEGVKVDKHSTGGVGDTTTLVLAPLVAACGAKVAKMSGRGLGFTGGTLDKLESIPGLSVSLSPRRFVKQVNEIGLAVIGQTEGLAPADKVLYALRDVTGTVASMPLIVSSILSKKLAAGAEAVVLDVKSGSGAIMPTHAESVALAKRMVEIGCRAGRRFSALVTDMDQPLGLQIGNALEVEEAISVLRGETAGPLLEVSLELGARMLMGARLAESVEEAKAQLRAALASGAGLNKFGEMIERQGGDARVLTDTGRLPQPKARIPLRAKRSGYLAEIRTQQVGYAARALGAGRVKKGDAIRPEVGVVLRKRLGDPVRAGEELLTLNVADASDVEAARALLEEALRIGDEPPTLPPLIHEAIEAAEAGR